MLKFMPPHGGRTELTMNTYNKEELISSLFSMQDLNFRDFQASLIPNISRETVIGVRTPLLRSFAKKYAKTADAEGFLSDLPHAYFEENNLHGFIIETLKDYGKVIAALDAFLPYVDNWATCDLMSPKVLKAHPDELIYEIKRWIASKSTYTVRFAIGALMSYYLDENFSPEVLEIASAVKSDEYYINMMTAWFFATALAKQYDCTLPYLTEKRLDAWVHNKTIRKAVESNRISNERKAYLKTLKIK